MVHLDEWYAAVLPAGVSWHGWRPCNPSNSVVGNNHLFADQGFQRTWLSQDVRSWLGLQTCRQQGRSGGPDTISVTRTSLLQGVTPVC